MSERPGLWMRRTLSGLAPADEASGEALRRIKAGDMVECRITRPRNVSSLRRWWALCNMIAYHCENFRDSPELAHAFLKIRSGHGIPVASPRTGEIFILPGSISFGALGEDQFKDLWRRAVKVVCEEVLPGISEADIENEILRLIGAAA